MRPNSGGLPAPIWQDSTPVYPSWVPGPGGPVPLYPPPNPAQFAISNLVYRGGGPPPMTTLPLPTQNRPSVNQPMGMGALAGYLPQLAQGFRNNGPVNMGQPPQAFGPNALQSLMGSLASRQGAGTTGGIGGAQGADLAKRIATLLALFNGGASLQPPNMRPPRPPAPGGSPMRRV